LLTAFGRAAIRRYSTSLVSSSPHCSHRNAFHCRKATSGGERSNELHVLTHFGHGRALSIDVFMPVTVGNTCLIYVTWPGIVHPQRTAGASPRSHSVGIVIQYTRSGFAIHSRSPRPQRSFVRSIRSGHPLVTSLRRYYGRVPNALIDQQVRRLAPGPL
jgi:hypothetical protein